MFAMDEPKYNFLFRMAIFWHTWLISLWRDSYIPEFDWFMEKYILMDFGINYQEQIFMWRNNISLLLNDQVVIFNYSEQGIDELSVVAVPK